MRLYDTSHSDYTLLRKINGLDVGWSIIDTAFSSDGNMFAYSSWSENGKCLPWDDDKSGFCGLREAMGPLVCAPSL
ncbi:hypothetical protein M8J77_012405 [Diaphorina citri]|nr:hypothetical protein M8J77_012405 [Diaphorina citri]